MPNTQSFNRSIGAGIGAIAVVSLLSSMALVTTASQLHTAIEARERSHAIVHQLDAFRTAMLNQETGLRGYLLTKNEASLEPYRSGVPALDAAVVQLRQLLGGNAGEAGRLADAAAAARAWQTDIGEAVIRDMADPTTRAEAAAVERGGEGKQRFDEFRAKLDAIEGEEQESLAGQREVLARAERNAFIALWAGALTTFLICGAIALAIIRMIARPLGALAEVMRRLASRDLSVGVPNLRRRDQVGDMARALEVFRQGLIELDRTSLLRAIADTLPAMVGYVDAERRVGFLNGEFARWFALQVDDVSQLHGKKLATVFAPEPFPGSARELATALSGEDVRFEHQLAPRGMARRDLEGFYRPHHAPDGRILGAVTLLTDITDRKRLERRLAQQARDLKRSNEELEQFAYVASHDLKAPLRGIENLVTWIEEDIGDALTGDSKTNMGLLKSRVRRLESLLDDLLAYSRAGRSHMAVDRIDTGALVEELATLVSPPAGFSIVPAPDLPTVEAARAPLTQVLQNLIGNAIKHHDHPAVGHVWVEASRRGDMTEFMVADDGPGIPERFRERVFGMFQTLKPRDEVEGSGMGLAIVQKLVDRQGGRIWLEGRRDGRGLAVHFVWPQGARENQDGTDRQPAAGG
jgi:PAS domain S-box-containing protein